MPKAQRGFRTIPITFRGSSVSVYASPRIADALKEIEKDMAVFHGVKLHQVLEAVYVQGKKDGAAETFGLIDRGVADAKKVIPHRRPGRPRKRAAA
jgi:hypothetical protein